MQVSLCGSSCVGWSRIGYGKQVRPECGNIHFDQKLYPLDLDPIEGGGGSINVYSVPKSRLIGDGLVIP